MKECEEYYKDLLKDLNDLIEENKELKSKYLATINAHIAEKLDWLKQVGKLHDRIRTLERGCKL